MSEAGTAILQAIVFLGSGGFRDSWVHFFDRESHYSYCSMAPLKQGATFAHLEIWKLCVSDWTRHGEPYPNGTPGSISRFSYPFSHRQRYAAQHLGMVNQNAENEVYHDFKYWEDRSDEFRDGAFVFNSPPFFTGWWFQTCFIFHIWDVILPID